MNDRAKFDDPHLESLLPKVPFTRRAFIASSLDAVERLRAALVAFGKDKQSMIHVYEGMPHAFHADYPPSYRKEAAEDGWKRMLAWFKKNGVA
jgi:dienelactone hydrolase